MKLQLNFVKPNEVSTNEPIDLGNGRSAIPHKRVVDSIYHLDYPFRSVDGKTELVELELQGTGEGDDEYEKAGTAAKSIMQEIINNLPKR